MNWIKLRKPTRAVGLVTVLVCLLSVAATAYVAAPYVEEFSDEVKISKQTKSVATTTRALSVQQPSPSGEYSGDSDDSNSLDQPHSDSNFTSQPVPEPESASSSGEQRTFSFVQVVRIDGQVQFLESYEIPVEHRQRLDGDGFGHMIGSGSRSGLFVACDDQVNESPEWMRSLLDHTSSVFACGGPSEPTMGLSRLSERD